MPKKLGSSMNERFLFLGRNSGIHGLNHLFRQKTFFLARIFWLTVMLVSSGCLYLLLVPAIELDSGINFTPDTLYLNWTTTFPAVTVCENMYATDAAMRLNKHYPDLVKPLSYDQRRYLVDMLYGRGKCSKTRCFPCGPLIACDVPWRKVMESVHRSCEELITDCFYTGVEFSCCKVFRIVDSEYGPCYSFNTLQNAMFVKEQFTVDRTTGPGVLGFRLLYDAKVSIHSSEELSTNNLDSDYNFLVRTYQSAEILFSVLEIDNDPFIKDVEISERGCRFPHEVPDELFHTYPVYSYGACKLARSMEHSYEQCGCITPLRDLSYQKDYCNYTGLNCLALHEAQMKLGLEKGHSDKDCVTSCIESELAIIDDYRTILQTPEERGEGNLVIVRMSSLPTLRYQRNLLRTNLDIVVSVGGMAGLFFSASILSVVEIFYLVLRKQNKSTVD